MRSVESGGTPAPADPNLVIAWLRARSRVRGLPRPVADSGGWRVDTGTVTELRRYVFASAVPGLRDIAEAIREPLVFLKLCGSPEDLRALLPGQWQILPPGTMMVRDSQPETASPPLPAGYRLSISAAGMTTTVQILAADGTIAARGHAGEYGGVFIYDRIATDPAHGRRGLGTIVMAALARARRSPLAREILVATADGRALYRTIAWTDHSPYTTAAIPAPDGGPTPATTGITR